MFASDAIAGKHYAASIFLRTRITRERCDDMRGKSREGLAEALCGL
ncbi:hypothetical protein [Bradyrhizobium guangxiense]|nr:hypothetical protein [Bradyrhizobium guangxiense]